MILKSVRFTFVSMYENVLETLIKIGYFAGSHKSNLAIAALEIAKLINS